MIVGLVGFIGSGKGTVGKFLDEKGFFTVSFAEAVKDATAIMFNWPRPLLEGVTEASRKWREEPDEFWSKKFGKPFTPRLALQLMGTEVGRNTFHEDFWVYRLQHKIEHLNLQGANIVVTDVRFKNEITWLRNLGGFLINVQRGQLPSWYGAASIVNNFFGLPVNPSALLKSQEIMNDAKVHESEWRWIGCGPEYTIHNNGTIEKLKENLDIIISQRLTPANVHDRIEEVAGFG